MLPLKGLRLSSLVRAASPTSLNTGRAVSPVNGKTVLLSRSDLYKLKHCANFER